MVDILVRNVDPDIARRLKQKAKAKGTSLNETAREALAHFVTPGREEAWAEADRFREKIFARTGRLLSDSTADIREWRDNKKPYR